MIPIQCPECGRRGHVPPDKFGARLHCKGCHVIFHLDDLGRIELGEPGTKVHRKPRAAEPRFDLAGTWRDVPRPARFAAPAACVVLLGWMLLPSAAVLPYKDQATAVGRAVLDGDRPGVVASATPASAEAAGRWYDLVRGPIAERGTGPAGGRTVTAALFAGNPEHDSSIEMSVIVATDKGTSSFNLPMVQEGGRWLVDGARSLDEARKAASISLARAKVR